MTHLSRLSEELILWMSPRVGFIDLADRFCTGSSIMPQKKNPDVPELARGKTGRVNGHLIGLLTLMKGQPLAYNKDNQEDKEPLFDAADTLRDTLTIFADMVGGIKVKPEAMRSAALQGYATATDLADYLVKKGVPFRDAHETVAHAVRACEDKGCDLADLSLQELQQFHASIEADVHQATRDSVHAILPAGDARRQGAPAVRWPAPAVPHAAPPGSSGDTTDARRVWNPRMDREGGAGMAHRFHVGDHVTWNSEAGHVSGTVTKVHTEDFDYKGHTRRASRDDPQYEIESDTTDHIAAHRGSALRPAD
jgi:hypothetical protein